MISNLCFTAQKRAAISADPVLRQSVISNSVTANWKAAIMARAMNDPYFRLDPKVNAKGLEWMARDFSVILKDMKEKCEFSFTPGRVVAKYLGHVVGEMDYSVRYSLYLGRYVYCNTPHLTGSQIRMGYTQYPNSRDHEETGEWIPCGLMVNEGFRRKGLGTLLVAAAMMREYQTSGARFMVIGDPAKETVDIGRRLGLENLARGTMIGGHIDPMFVNTLIEGWTERPLPIIQSINVRHGDPFLADFLKNCHVNGVKSKGTEGLAMYDLPLVTWENLKLHNVQLPLRRGCQGYAETTDRWELMHGDNILFTSRKGIISTRASLDLSYILWDRKSGIAAAIQTSAIQIDQKHFQKTALRIALANILNLSPDAEIMCFVSGGCNGIDAFLHPKDHARSTVQIRDTVMSVVTEAISRGAYVAAVDVGGHYRSQQLDTATGEYSAKLEPLE